MRFKRAFALIFEIVFLISFLCLKVFEVISALNFATINVFWRAQIDEKTVIDAKEHNNQIKNTVFLNNDNTKFSYYVTRNLS